MSDFVPVMSDEISYWHQIASFREAGFAGGYYTYNENPASASFAHYGAHGFLYPMMMASFSFFVGWNYSTVFFFNIAWYTFSLVVFLIYSRKMLNIYQLILIVLVILTFWSSHIYMSTGMRVVFFNGYSIILAALRPLHNLPPRSSKAHLSCIIDT